MQDFWPENLNVWNGFLVGNFIGGHRSKLSLWSDSFFPKYTPNSNNALFYPLNKTFINLLSHLLLTNGNLPHHSGSAALACTLVSKIPSDIAKIFHHEFSAVFHAKTKQYLLFSVSISQERSRWREKSTSITPIRIRSFQKGAFIRQQKDLQIYYVYDRCQCFLKMVNAHFYPSKLKLDSASSWHFFSLQNFNITELKIKESYEEAEFEELE